MLAAKLATRNLLGAGLRTWLNVFILSLSYVIIIWYQGLLAGWDGQVRRDMIHWEIGSGQYWHTAYDPYDPFTLEDGRGRPPEALKAAVDRKEAVEVLVSQASIYPQGRLMGVLLKGIDPDQSVLDMPTATLNAPIPEIPVLIGARMARSAKLKLGDAVTVQWRDANGTFDAAELRITGLMKTNVGSIDNGQLWVPMERLRHMLATPDIATYVVMATHAEPLPDMQGWVYRNHDFLLKEITEMIKMKSAGSSVMYLMLLFLAWLAIFDTQVLSIFRRRKEIGTLIALGMTRNQVIRLFTLEGSLHGILALILAAIYGTPLLVYMAVKGWTLPEMTDEMGLNTAQTLYATYGPGLVLSTIVIVMLSVVIVSFLPARTIATLKPTDAIKGKLT